MNKEEKTAWVNRFTEEHGRMTSRKKFGQAEGWKISKIIPGYDYRYSVSRCGLIINKKTGKGMRPFLDNGILYVQLWQKGKQKKVAVHNLVAHAFVPKKAGYTVVYHLDGDPLNCRTSNLVYVSRSMSTRMAQGLVDMNDLPPILKEALRPRSGGAKGVDCSYKGFMSYRDPYDDDYWGDGYR